MTNNASIDSDKLSIHSCSYYCDRPKCIKDQRDILRDNYVISPGVKSLQEKALNAREQGEDVAESGDDSPCALELDRAISSLNTCASKCTTDDPEMDASDFGHPAWWRGHEYTTAAFCREVNKLLDCGEAGAEVSGEPWHELKKRLVNLRKNQSEAVAFVPLHPTTGPLWSETYPVSSTVERSQNYKAMTLYNHPMRELADLEVWELYQTIHTAYDKDCYGSDYTKFVGNVFRDWLKKNK